MNANGIAKARIGLVATAAVIVALAADDAGVDPTVERSPGRATIASAAAEKLPPFTLSRVLCDSAEVHARDMAKHQTLDHTGSDGSTVAERVKRKSYAYVRMGENIAKGQKTVEQVMTSWMNSPGHRANILANFTEMGAARIQDDDGEFYWCVNFGIPIPRLNPADAAATVLTLINQDRQAKNEPALKAEPTLGRGAMSVSAAMAAKDSLEVDGDPFKLIGEKELEGKEVRLQLSANVPTPEAAAKALVGDDRDQLATFRQIGIGYALAKNGTPYWCAIFARPARPRLPGTPK